ncbi:hypothetical protein AYO47_01080 [Planctomyces sp. SCGC AG-212-M04]|nr:hypothetical protein AYO47_01080 [Planctomyces sp. SCGC AG-212-M04]
MSATGGEGPASRVLNTIVNFGRNVSFQPQVHETPKSEAEVLDLLRRHRGQRIRAYGSLHSWSRVATTNGVAVDVSQLNSIELQTDGAFPTARVGGGCQIKRLVVELNRQGWTLPSLGLIKEQTIAGATSTATHGSGRHCLSYYIQSMRIATYDSKGEPVIREISQGRELEAARCGLGSLGIITSITLTIRPQYQIEEYLRLHPDLASVLAAEEQTPLQQFFLIPWSWAWFDQHRRESSAPRGRSAGLYRLFWSLGMDRAFHWIIVLLARMLPGRCTSFFYRRCMAMLIPQNWHAVDRSDRQLTMQHQLFRHIETEIFVTRSNLEPMLSFTRWLLEWSEGNCDTQAEWTRKAGECGLLNDLDALAGQYQHHYPICVRKVLPDDGLLTMSGGGAEPWYAISFISYAPPSKRAGFLLFSSLLIRLSGQLFNARPHWGKARPSRLPDAHRLYPALDEFLRLRDEIDPTGAFRQPELT